MMTVVPEAVDITQSEFHFFGVDVALGEDKVAITEWNKNNKTGKIIYEVKSRGQ